MNYLFALFADSQATSAEASSSSSNSGTSESSLESLKQIFTNPILYIVLGALVLLIIAIYLIRRTVKARPNATTIIVRKGKIHKVLNEKEPKYFMIPFVDSVGAIIDNNDKTLASDKLFINNGPDALYKIDYVLKYRVLDPVAFFPYIEKIGSILPTRLNDELRLFADEGNALVLIKDYRSKSDEILALINKAIAEYHIEAVEFKINLILPMGGK